MIIKINMKSETPIYLQLRNEIVKGIGKGEFEIGESLPTVRQMAAELGVNTMTVSKAYQLLKSEGFIVTDRRKGTIVCNPQSDENKLGGEFQEKLADELELLSAEASTIINVQQGIKRIQLVGETYGHIFQQLHRFLLFVLLLIKGEGFSNAIRTRL